MESNKLTVIVPDKAVYRDIGAFLDLDLSGCNIPEDVCVIQWMQNESKGWIEYIRSPYDTSPKPNEHITELPEWALKCIAVWEEAYARVTS